MGAQKRVTLMGWGNYNACGGDPSPVSSPTGGEEVRGQLTRPLRERDRVRGRLPQSLLPQGEKKCLARRTGSNDHRKGQAVTAGLD